MIQQMSLGTVIYRVMHVLNDSFSGTNNCSMTVLETLSYQVQKLHLSSYNQEKSYLFKTMNSTSY